MATEKEDLLDKLSWLTGDLSPLPHVPPAQLEQARTAIALAQAAQQREPIAGATTAQRVSGGRAASADAQASIASIIDSTLERPPARPEYLVARREFPLPLSAKLRCPTPTPAPSASRSRCARWASIHSPVARPRPGTTRCTPPRGRFPPTRPHRWRPISGGPTCTMSIRWRRRPPPARSRCPPGAMSAWCCSRSAAPIRTWSTSARRTCASAPRPPSTCAITRPTNALCSCWRRRATCCARFSSSLPSG